MEGFIYILLWLVTGVIFGVMSIVSWAVTTAENEYKNRSKRQNLSLMDNNYHCRKNRIRHEGK